MKLQMPAVIGLLIGLAAASLATAASHAAEPATAQHPQISAAASDAVQRMGATLRANQFSFDAKTLRVYAGPKGEPLHIFHTLSVTVDRPNRMLVVRDGDDGQGKLVYNGKTLYIYAAQGNKYASIPVPGTIEGMMKEAMGRLGVDFPLADLLSDAPDKAFLSGVTEGDVVNRVTIDGVPSLHMFFVQPPGLELELWVQDNAQALPLRLIVTYRSLPGVPNFVATFSNWNFSVHPSDSDFAFQPPAGAQRVELKSPAGPAAKGAASRGAK